MKLDRTHRARLQELISRASPLTGDFFRSVAFRYFHPDDVVSGEGTRLHGGRFVPPGVPAVFASVDEETAVREATARKRLLSGGGHIDFCDYPRMTYILRIKTQRNVEFCRPAPPGLEKLLSLSLRSGSHAVSQVVAAILLDAGIESLVFPSATGCGRNVVVYLPNTGNDSVIVLNRAAVLAALRSETP